MVWSELEYIEQHGYLLNFNQQKTGGVEVLPISEQAYSFTHGTENPKDMPRDKKVFDGLKYSAYHNKHLFQWIGAAGITKNITFHCFRHTYAVLQLQERPDGTQGTDIYTVSKMLGHKDLKTTQIYAKIVDAAKRKAADKIQLDM
jgi:integrase